MRSKGSDRCYDPEPSQPSREYTRSKDHNCRSQNYEKSSEVSLDPVVAARPNGG